MRRYHNLLLTIITAGAVAGCGDATEVPIDMSVNADMAAAPDMTAAPPDLLLARLLCGTCHVREAAAMAAGKHKAVDGDCVACHKDAMAHQAAPDKVRAAIDFSMDGCAAAGCHAEYKQSMLHTDAVKLGHYGGSIKTSKYVDFPKYQHLMGGHGFTIEYNEERAHGYMLKDHVEIARKQNTTCLQCKATPVTYFWNEQRRGQPVFGKDMDWAVVVQKLKTEWPGIADYGAGCNHCHDPHGTGFRILRKQVIASILERGTDPYGGSFNFVPKTPAELMKKMNERDQSGALTPQARRLAGTLTCAQCHIEYVCGPGIDKDKGINRDEVPWRKARDIEAYYRVKFDLIQDWKHAGTGIAGIKPQHPETEFYWESKHYKSGVSCADCHMGHMGGKSDHFLTSPLKRPVDGCAKCHVDDAEARLARVVVIQDAAMARAKALETEMDSVLLKIESNPTVEPAKLAEAKERFMRALFFWEWTAVSENSAGFHNPEEAAANFGAAEGEIVKAKALLGMQ